MVNIVEKPSRPAFDKNGKKDFHKSEYPARRANSGAKEGTSEGKDYTNKKPIQRRIIPQDIYENKPGGSSKHGGSNNYNQLRSDK